MEQFLLFLQKSPMYMVLFGLSVVSAGLLIVPFLTRGVRGLAEVGPGEAVTLINRKDAVVLDIRDEAEFAAGHINNARHIPEKQVAERAKELEKLKSRPLVVCCATGRRSASVVSQLRKDGYIEAVALGGGIAAWTQAGMPLEK